SGNNLTPSLQNGGVVQHTGCQVGSCVSLDGIDDHVQVAHSSALDFAHADSFSLAVWLNTADAGADIRIAGKQNVAGQNGIYILRIVSGKANAFFRDTNAVTSQTTSTVTVNDGNWHHVVAVRDTASDTIKIYVDGGNVQSVTDNSTGSYTSAIPFMIGAHIAEGFSDNFDGVIDEVQIYKRALSPHQISQIYNEGLAGFGGPSVISAHETSSGDLWQTSITPIDALGMLG